MQTDPSSPSVPSASPASSVASAQRTGTAAPGARTSGLTLFLELADPRRMRELLDEIESRRDEIDRALEGLHYVHYARFVPTPTHLLVVTEYDGSDDAYVLDFAAVLDEPFTAILGFVKDPPPLPVSSDPHAFLRFVRRHDVAIKPWSAHGDRTVLELQAPFRTPDPGAPETALAAAAAAAAAVATEKAPTIDTADVQGNLLRSYPARRARHFALRVTAPAQARDFLGGVTGGRADWPQVSSANDAADPAAQHFLNVGLTFSGLRALGVSEAVLDAFPQAFREGPAHGARAADNGDTGSNGPACWLLGRPDAPVDLLVSLYLTQDDEDALGAAGARLAALFDDHGLRVVYCRDTRALPTGRVHFGYRDGIGQPRIAGIERPAGEPGGPDRQPLVRAGDFLLGCDYRNHFGGNWIGRLPHWLCDNATYAAVRMLSQHVAAFERMLTTESQRHGIDREVLAAKLMGRWRNGEPLVLSPDRECGTLADGQLNDFDYGGDDGGGRCPLGSHARRMNPRGALVAGKPYSRRVMRRGMSYGPAWTPHDVADEAAVADDKNDRRGVFGMFLCADLQTQYEFILRAWANGDRAAAGLRGTQDPIVGTRETPCKFHLPVAGQTKCVEVEVPPLVTTRGSLYLLMPGIGGLKQLAQLDGTGVRAAARSGGATNATHFVPAAFDPADPAFRADPYATYALFRKHAPVAWVPRYEAWWVFSHALVKEVCEARKPGTGCPAGGAPSGDAPGKEACEALPRFPKKMPPPGPQGLFFMDPPRHSQVRPRLDELFAAAIGGLPAHAERLACELLDARPRAFDLIAGYAKPLFRDVLMTLLGIAREADRRALGDRIDALLDGHDLLATVSERHAGEEARRMLADRFAGVWKGKDAGWADEGGLLHAMASATGEGGRLLSKEEFVGTAINFALAGYLSCEFLLGTGVHELLRNSAQWRSLVNGKDVDRAVQEMLRYHAPFQLADRHAAETIRLGKVTIPRGARVTVVYGSANRDKVFGPDADEFDIGREPPPGTEWGALALSPGIHRCIGKPLICHTLPIAVETLVRRRPDLRLDGEPEWRGDPYFRSIRRLPVAG